MTMYFQDEYIRSAAAASRGSTFKLDLPDTGILGSLLIRADARVATGNPMGGIEKWRLIDYLDKIEVVLNGSTVCKSLSGTQLQFLTFMDQKVIAPSMQREYSQPYQREYLLLNFGRKYNDPSYALHLDNFNSVELHITNSCPTAYFQDALNYTIVAHWIREPAGSPGGYLRSEEWRKWATVAAETKYLDLPTEHTLRRIVLQAFPDVDGSYIEETSIFNLIYDLELSFLTGVLRVFKGTFHELLYQNVFDSGVYPMVGGTVYNRADVGFYTGIGYTDLALVSAGSHTGAASGVVPTLLADNQNGTQKMESASGDIMFPFLSRGLGYHNCGYFRFDYEDDPGTWLSTAARKTVQLNVKTRDSASAADGTIAVVLDRLVRY